RYVDGLIGCGLLHEDNGQIHRPDTASGEFVLLTLLARSIIQMLERFYMVAALLLNNPNGSLTAEQLEALCTVMAQRLSILHGLNAPEFFDKTLFRQFIQRLQDTAVLTSDADDRLHYQPELEDIAENTARRVLSAEIRLSIRQVARSAGQKPALSAVSAPGRRCIRLPPGASGRNCHASRGGNPCGRNPGTRPADAGRNPPCPTASAFRATRCAG